MDALAAAHAGSCASSSSTLKRLSAAQNSLSASGKLSDPVSL